MQKFPIKTISIKQCKRCDSQWITEKVSLEVHDQINIAIIKISYCPNCAEGWASEIDRPTYERTGKRIK